MGVGDWINRNIINPIRNVITPGQNNTGGVNTTISPTQTITTRDGRSGTVTESPNGTVTYSGNLNQNFTVRDNQGNTTNVNHNTLPANKPTVIRSGGGGGGSRSGGSTSSNNSGGETTNVSTFPAEKVPGVRSTDVVSETPYTNTKKVSDVYYTNNTNFVPTDPNAIAIYTDKKGNVIGDSRSDIEIPLGFNVNASYNYKGGISGGKDLLTTEIKDLTITETGTTLSGQGVTKYGFDVWGNSGKDIVTFNTPAGKSTYEVGSNEKLGMNIKTGEFSVVDKSATLPKDFIQISSKTGERTYGEQGFTAHEAYEFGLNRAQQGGVFATAAFLLAPYVSKGDPFGIKTDWAFITGKDSGAVTEKAYVNSVYSTSGETTTTVTKFTISSPISQTAVLAGGGGLVLGAGASVAGNVVSNLASKYPIVASGVATTAYYGATALAVTGGVIATTAPLIVSKVTSDKVANIYESGGNTGDVLSYGVTTGLNLATAGYTFNVGYTATNQAITNAAVNKLKDKPFIIDQTKSYEQLNYNTAYDGYYKSYNIVATREARRASQTLNLNLKAIPTGENTYGLGLSSGNIDTEIRSIFGNQYYNTAFKVTGRSEVLANDYIFKETAPGVYISNDKLASGGITQGYIYTDSGQIRGFGNIGVSQKNGEFIDIVGGKDRTFLRFNIEKMTATGANLNGKVIDFGSGDATLGKNTVGVDKYFYKSKGVEYGDYNDYLYYNDNSFSKVTSSYSMDVMGKQKAYNEAFRILQPGGNIELTTGQGKIANDVLTKLENAGFTDIQVSKIPDVFITSSGKAIPTASTTYTASKPFQSEIVIEGYNSLRSGVGIYGKVQTYNPTTSIDDYSSSLFTNTKTTGGSSFIDLNTGTAQVATQNIAQINLGSTLGGVSEAATKVVTTQVQTATYSTGAFAGLGLYERTNTQSVLMYPVVANVSPKLDTGVRQMQHSLLVPTISLPTYNIGGATKNNYGSAFAVNYGVQVIQTQPEQSAQQQINTGRTIAIPAIATPFFDTPIVTGGFIIPGLKGLDDSELSSRVIMGGSKNTRYAPSAYALIFKVGGSYKPGKLSKSGIDFRPITKGFKIRVGGF